ncbi:MAG: YkgJ family cysteine cluster protein [Rhodocyclaceae bacterium]|nr:YkgJ family cysteine cluster protein [Rhodocyclaceae bacterium]
MSDKPAWEAKPALVQLHADIEARVRSIREKHPDWLCGKGCDACCRRLSNVPQLTAAEWSVLRQGLLALAPVRREAICRKVAELRANEEPPIVCPLLDHANGTCPVYAERPIACRSYGFYVQRDRGLYCREIETHVAEGALADVVWGNHDAIDQRLAGMGESRPLTEWFAAWKPEINRP